MFIRVENDPNNRLFVSYKEGNIDEFKKALEDGCNPNCVADLGLPLLTFIMYDTIEKEEKIIFFEELIKHDVFIGPIGSNPSAVHEAIDSYFPNKYFELLITKTCDKNNNLNELTSEDMFYALRKVYNSNISNGEKIIIMAKHANDLSLINEKGDGLIHSLLSFGDDFVTKECLPYFIEKGSLVTHKNSNGLDSFFIAIKTKQDEKIFDIMLAAGADINCRGTDNRTVLMESVLQGNIKTTKYLLKHNPSIDLVDDFGQTAIIFAGKSSFDSLKILVEYGGDLSFVDNEGHTALHYFAEITKFSNEEINFLAKHKDLLFIEDSGGVTSMDIMKMQRKPDLYKKLVKLLDHENDMVNSN